MKERIWRNSNKADVWEDGKEFFFITSQNLSDKRKKSNITCIVNKDIKCCVPCSGMLLSGLVSAGGSGASGSSEQLPGDRN